MRSGSNIEVVAVSHFQGRTEASVIWTGVVPHDSDYAGLESAGSELGYNILEAIARQDPWEVSGFLVVVKD